MDRIGLFRCVSRALLLVRVLFHVKRLDADMVESGCGRCVDIKKAQLLLGFLTTWQALSELRDISDTDEKLSEIP